MEGSALRKTPAPTVRDWIEYLSFRAVVGLVRALPTDLSIRLMGRIWAVVAPRLKRHRRALKHIRRAMPELSAAQSEAIIRSMWRNLGMTAAETMLLDRLYNEPSRLEISEESQDILALQRGVLITLHQGNWEILTAPMGYHGHKVAAVYQRIRNPLVDGYVRQQRKLIYQGGLYNKGKEAAINLMKHAESGFVGIVADLRDAKKVTVPFFGMPAPSTPFPAMIALSRDIPIIAGRAIRTAPGRFRLETRPVPVSQTGNREADVLQTTQAIQAVFEEWVRDVPDQWMWAHKRWDESSIAQS